MTLNKRMCKYIMSRFISDSLMHFVAPFSCFIHCDNTELSNLFPLFSRPGVSIKESESFRVVTIYSWKLQLCMLSTAQNKSWTKLKRRRRRKKSIQIVNAIVKMLIDDCNLINWPVSENLLIQTWPWQFIKCHRSRTKTEIRISTILKSNQTKMNGKTRSLQVIYMWKLNAVFDRWHHHNASFSTNRANPPYHGARFERCGNKNRQFP